MSSNKHYRNFHRVSKEPAGQCQLKNHFFGAHREVIGYLEAKAKQDPEGFVFPHVATIVARCKKFETKENYGHRYVEKILRDLRTWHIIGPRVRRTRNYQELSGFIVTPHDALCARVVNDYGKEVCRFDGTWHFGRWHVAFTEKDGIFKTTAIQWAGWPDEKLIPAPVVPGATITTSKPSMLALARVLSKPVVRAVARAVAKPGERAVERTVTTLQHALESKGVNPENSALAFEPSEPTLAKVTYGTQPKRSLDSSADVRSDAASRNPKAWPAGHKSVAEHFRGYFIGEYCGSYGTEESHIARRDFDRLTSLHLIWTQVHGDFKNVPKKATFTAYPHWPELYRACADAIKAHSENDTEWLGKETGAKIMRDAANILRRRHNLDAPRWWFPLMDKLRGKKRKAKE